MSHIKLKLEVNVKNKMIIGNDRALETYYLVIKILEKDEEFEAEFVESRFLVHPCTNGFRIRSVWDEPYGRITDDGLIIPESSKLNDTELKKTYPTDFDRYVYLKKLRVALEEWANYWIGFKYDGEAEFTMVGNIWTISCEQRIKTDMKVQRKIQEHRRTLLNNIFI